MSINIPYSFIRLTILCILLVGLRLFIPLPFVGFLDEILMGCSLILILTHPLYLKRCKSVWCVLLIYLIYCILNYFISPYSNSFYMMLLQSCITLKVFLVMVALFLSYTSLTKQQKTRITKIVKLTARVFVLIFFCSLVLNIILGTTWMNMWGLPIMYRNGMLRVFGMFNEGGANGYFIAFIVTTLLYFYLSAKLNLRNVFIIAVIAIALAYISSYRKTALFCIPLFMIYNNNLNTQKRMINIIFGGVLALILLYYMVGSAFFDDTFRDLSNFTNNDSNYIRGLLFYNGFWLAAHMFPFGTGAATFGSVYSQFNTLAVYRLVGMERWVLDFEEGAEVFDNYLGSIVAENGVIGMIIYIILIKKIYNLIITNIRIEYKPWFKIIYIYLLITSILGPFICSADGVIIFSMFLIYFLCKNETISSVKYVSRR